MVNVEFNARNIERCLCPECPVQQSSSCVREQLNKIQQSGGVPTDPKESPGVYCATGMATCTDIDRNQPCQCGKCEVWKEYELGKGQPGGYYCVNGEAR